MDGFFSRVWRGFVVILIASVSANPAVAETTDPSDLPLPPVAVPRPLPLTNNERIRGPLGRPPQSQSDALKLRQSRLKASPERLEAEGKKAADEQRDLKDTLDRIAKQPPAENRGDSGGGGGRRSNRDDSSPFRGGDILPPPPLPEQLPQAPPAPFGDLPPEPPARRTPAPVVGDKSPIDDSQNLLIDLDFGTKNLKDDARAEKTKKRLAAIVFAINSINTSTKKLLTVDELIKDQKLNLKKTEQPTVKIDLTKYLKPTQISVLRQVLTDEALNCAKAHDQQRSNRAPGEATPEFEPLRADVIVKAILDQSNYYKLLELSESRSGFEQDEGIRRDFSVPGPQKDTTESTMRLIVPPGKSGIVHGNTQRLILLQEGRNGLVIRTGDVDRSEGSKASRNFIQHPGTASPSGSEEIWELPNGMRAYSARNGKGELITQVPHGLVNGEISNTSCVECHGGLGYIAGSGKHDSMKWTGKGSIPRTGVVDETVSGQTFGNRNLFRATWDDYMGAIEPANKRYAAAKNKSGAAPGDAAQVIADYKREKISIAEIAEELGSDPADVQTALFTRRIRSGWDLGNHFAKPESQKDATLTRTQLESEIDLGPGVGDQRNKSSLYCAVKDLARDQQAKLGDQRPKGDAFARGNPRVGPAPVSTKKTHTSL